MKSNFLFNDRLYTNLLTDSLSEYSYNAEVAGLTYYLSQETKGIIVSLDTTTLKLTKQNINIPFMISYMLVDIVTNCHCYLKKSLTK